jgi:hypothetical protein
LSVEIAIASPSMAKTILARIFTSRTALGDAGSCSASAHRGCPGRESNRRETMGSCYVRRSFARRPSPLVFLRTAMPAGHGRFLLSGNDPQIASLRDARARSRGGTAEKSGSLSFTLPDTHANAQFCENFRLVLASGLPRS